MLDNKYYQWFRVIITLLVALVYFSHTLEKHLVKEIYDFLIKNRDLIIGTYYVYIAYDIYINNQNSKPV
jgi:hypothetical protein